VSGVWRLARAAAARALRTAARASPLGGEDVAEVTMVSFRSRSTVRSWAWSCTT